MRLAQTILTFVSAAVQFPAPTDNTQTIHLVTAEPLRSNAHVCSVGIASVVNDASGVGVVCELAAGPAITVPLDRFSYQPSTSGNNVDPTVFYAQGTAGEKIKVSYFST